MIDGSCQACDDFQVVDKTSTGCETAPPCLLQNQILLTDTSCEFCPEYMVDDETSISCVTPSCLENDIVYADGLCGTCPEYFYPNYEDNKTCI